MHARAGHVVAPVPGGEPNMLRRSQDRAPPEER
jgi:hypothetical protein